MLRGIQKASRNWLGKAVLAVVMGLLVVSFAIWGIGDIFRGFGRSTVAKVGGTEIGIEAFRQIYNDRLQQIARQVGRPITPDQARALGFDRQVLGQVVAETALDERARQMRLAASDEAVVQKIMSEPTFRGITGQFDRTRFLQIIRQAGYTEARFVAEQRKVMLRQQLVGTLSSGVAVPHAAVDAVNRYQNEQRAVEYVVLDREAAGDIPAPAPEDLASYFEERKALFRAPEYRKLTLLSLTPAELAPWIEISDDDVRKAYEERQNRYSTPERRQIQQIVFPTEQEARAAAERIKAGTPFTDIAAERGLKPADYDLGLIAQSAVLDPAVGTAAFALASGSTSEPVQGRFGWVLVHVVRLEAGHIRPFDQVAAEIRRDLGLERARSELNTRYDKIEDERLAGGTLAEIAQRVGMTARTIEAVDRSGRGPDGAPALGLPQEVIGPAFSAEVGTENDPVRLPDGGYMWYEVTDSTPSRERSLDEVKDRVEERWREDKIAERIRAKATEIVDKAKAGTPLAEAAPGLSVQTATELKRATRSEALPARAIEEIFRTPKDGVGSAEGDSATQRVVFKVTAITVPETAMDSAEAKAIRETLSRGYSEEVLSQYIARLESDLGTSINQAALNQIVGGGSGN